MKKSDLKTGMIVELNDGYRYLVQLDTGFQYESDYIITEHSYIPMSNIDDDLCVYDVDFPTLKIIAVYMPDEPFLCYPEDFKACTLIWRRSPEYYLRDVFYAPNNEEDSFLNFSREDNFFFIGTMWENGLYQTQFTDQDIKDLKIPIERFEKILVEDN